MKLNIYVLLLIFLVILMYFQPSFLGNLCTNCFGKATLVLLIVFLAIQDISLAILASVVLISSMHLVSREGFKEGAAGTAGSPPHRHDATAPDVACNAHQDHIRNHDEKLEDHNNNHLNVTDLTDHESDEDAHDNHVHDTTTETDTAGASGFRNRNGGKEGFMVSSSELISFEDSKIRGKDSNIYPVSRPSVQNKGLFSGFNLF